MKYLAFLFLVLLLSGCTQELVIESTEGASVRAVVTSESKDGEFWTVKLSVFDRAKEERLLEIVLDDSSDHPIPVGFVGIVLVEERHRIEILGVREGKYSMIPLPYTSEKRDFLSLVSSTGLRFERSGAPEAYRKTLSAYDERVKRTRRAATEGAD